jgi:two-component system OmpR family response regulator
LREHTCLRNRDIPKMKIFFKKTTADQGTGLFFAREKFFANLKENIVVNSNQGMAKTVKSKQKPAAKDKILVVDDDGQMGLVLDMVLQETRFELDYVSNIVSADQYLAKQLPVAVILDNKLPDGYGLDFIVYIKQKYPSLKIIMISGFGLARDAALENGADMFFEKPFNLDEFNAGIHQLLK